MEISLPKMTVLTIIVGSTLFLIAVFYPVAVRIFAEPSALAARAATAPVNGPRSSM